MSAGDRWEGIQPDSLFSRSIEQVMRDWGLVRASDIPMDPPTATVPNRIAEGLDEEDRIPCHHCDDMYRATGISPSTPLPPRDCYGGTGIGVWLDDFLDQGYAPEVDRNARNAKLDHMARHWKYWRDLGVTKVVTGYLSPTERDPILQRLSQVFQNPKTMIIDASSPQHQGGQRAGAFIPFLTYTPGYNNPPTLLPKFEFAPPLGPQDLDWIISTTNEQNYHFDELYDLMLSNPDLIKEFLISLSLVEPDTPIDVVLSEWENHKSWYIQLVLDYLNEMLAASDGQSPILRRIYLSTYDRNLIDMIVQNHAGHVRTGRLILSPDLYYSVASFSDIAKYYFQISRAFDDQNLQGYKRQIQPYIELKCDPCSSRTSPNNPCSPVRVVCDMLLMGLLGFGGPIFYTSAGIDQRFWEAAVLGSWIMGCLPAPAPAIPFRTVGDAIRYACSLFPEPDTSSAALARRTELQKFEVYRANMEKINGTDIPGAIYNNPKTCRTCCDGAFGGPTVLCYVKASPKATLCRDPLRCCDGPRLSCRDAVFKDRGFFCPDLPIQP